MTLPGGSGRALRASWVPTPPPGLPPSVWAQGISEAALIGLLPLVVSRGSGRKVKVVRGTPTPNAVVTLRAEGRCCGPV